MNEPPPEHCPGVNSSAAGSAPGCAGCPNATFCASGQAKSGPDPDVSEIAIRLSQVRNIILILSGKGGVGKSTLSTNLARALAIDEQVNVGLLDIDICGPSIPRTMALEGEDIHESADGWSPLFVQENLCVMSCGFMLPSLDEAVIWRGPKKDTLIRRFLKDVDWRRLDYLLIDTPPGTSDEHLSIVNLLAGCENLRGAVIVSTPQEMSLLDVRKQIDFCRRVKLKIIGLVENMAYFRCSKCSKSSNIFTASTGGVEKLCEQEQLPLLGRLAVDPVIAKACDAGNSIFDDDSLKSSEVVKEFLNIVERLQTIVK